jgi:hypothetical protein
MREHNKRLIIVIVVLIATFVGVRTLVVPESFGEYGWYRGASPGEIADRPSFFATSEDCATCHGKEFQELGSGVHKNLNCETCMGPGKKHVENPHLNRMMLNTSREFCGDCHEKRPARPESQPQIDLNTHHKGQLCIVCHNPHSPLHAAPPKAEVSQKSTGVDIFKNICSKCHVDTSLFGDLSKSQEEWRKGVEKMNKLWSLGLSDEQMDSITSYLKETYGK